MPDALEHITLSTGDSQPSHRSEVPQDIIATLRPLVLAGLAEIPSKPGFLLRVTRAGTAALFDIERDHTPNAPWPHGRSPIVTCGLAPHQ